jgi:hypothetical protein
MVSVMSISKFQRPEGHAAVQHNGALARLQDKNVAVQQIIFTRSGFGFWFAP